MKFLLYPFAVLYDLITRVRNYLYDTGRRGSVKFDANVIAVGNLTVGGTGKTPQVEYLIRLLKDRYKVATLSRGYGRKTKGFLLADEKSSATTLGDEPFQYYRKFGKEITVAVGEERALAIPSILMERPETNVILLDDAYQHRSVRPLLNILLSDYNRPFYEDHLLPMGRLRESRNGVERADIVVVTKCPSIVNEEEQKKLSKRINSYTKKELPVFFTSVEYSKPVSVFGEGGNQREIIGSKVLLFTGLANAQPFAEYVKKIFLLTKHMEFADHYDYKSSDIKRILSVFKELNAKDDHILITTEKDMVKLEEASLKILLKEVPLWYIPIEISFIKEKDKFDEIVKNKGIVF
jgi:tetraacyldisaccharide 4'-kinase